MSSRSLFRLGGLSAILGGVLMAVDVVMHLFVDDQLEPAAFAGIPHEVWHVPGIIALPMVLLGLVAIYLSQAMESGKLGLWGFVLLILGITAGAIYSTIFHGLFLPAIENLEGGLFETLVDNTTAAQFYRGVVVQALGLGLGAILFGAATIRSKVFPAVAGWLLIVAAGFAAANQVFVEGQLVSRALFGVSFIWLGVVLRQRYRTTSLQDTPT